jgi:hypothetical protein
VYVEPLFIAHIHVAFDLSIDHLNLFFFLHWELKEKKETLFPKNKDAATAHH